jgi:peptidoglycan/xylan/chitin deacetylase (PgdA/CDA1 family)/uncharacterized caspase-like protein
MREDSAVHRLVLLAFVVLAACRKSPPPPQPKPAAPPTVAPSAGSADLTARYAAIVRDHRAMIVLLGEEPESGSPEATAAWLLHERLQGSLEAMAELAATANARDQLLDKLENDTTLRDGDKLAFLDLLDELPTSPRLERDRQVLLGIRNRYDAEIQKLLAYLPTRGLEDKREAWDSYLAFVRATVAKEAILAEFQAELATLGEGSRGGGGAWKDDPDQIVGRRFPDKTLLLTFDDGPAKRRTPAVLEVLQRYGIKAVFFQVGKNVKKSSELDAQMVAAGHTLANHTFTHAFLPKLAEPKLERQLTDTNQALLSTTEIAPTLFRPPYGARSEKVRADTDKLGLKTVLWNIDSKDWADPVPASIARRVLGQVAQQKRGILLFHDIHARTAVALPLVLDELVKQGYTFLAWNGKDFVTPQVGEAAATPVASTLYRQSHAVIIGINAYANWPKLAYAANDAKAVRELLITRFGFAPDHIRTLLDGEATRDAIMAALGDDLADGKKVSREDRVLVFFAGHGATRKLPSGKVQGYIIPVEADAKSFQSQAISMTNFQDIADAIPAKHALFIMDACYSGLALTRGGAVAAGGDRRQYWQEITRRAARQMMTAGGADEQVADNGPGGHSIFTWTLLQGLQGKADMDKDGAITATELFSYLAPSVSALSRQTPAFGSMPGSEGGELVFVSKGEEEFLSEESKQLDAEAIALNAAIDKIRKEVEAKQAKVAQLKGELAVATAELHRQAAGARGGPDAGRGPDAAAVAAAPTLLNPTLSRQEADRGMGLYRERRYLEAAQAFESALRSNPGNVLAANNLGFTYVKLDRLPEAIAWYQKTLLLDPQRALAHANLGDAYAKVGRLPEAKAEYARFLALKPDHKLAPAVRERLGKLAADAGR